MKTASQSVLLLGLTIFSFGTISAQAADSKPLDRAKTAKMTCEDFIALDEVARPKVIYWADGFNRKGQIDDEVIDFGRDDRLVPMLVEECAKNPKHSLVAKVKAEAKKAKSL